MSLPIADAADSLISPSYQRIDFPKHGFIWVGIDKTKETCDLSADHNWLVKTSLGKNIFVDSILQRGSGRYWTITVGIGHDQASKPSSGFCLKTTTIGWRILQKFEDTPLTWIDDLDADGNAELIIWSSFYVKEQPDYGFYGLMAWVYRMSNDRSFIIDWPLSRNFAAKIASAYRLPLKNGNAHLLKQRRLIALELELFARNISTTILKTIPTFQK